MLNPIPYAPDVERPEADEAHTTQELIDTLLKISSKVHEDEGHARRSVHAKSHAILKGTLSVPALADSSLAQGLFATAGDHEVLMRFSSTPGDLLKDTVSTPRGLALKIYDVPGARVPDAPGQTQDFIFVNGPVFAAPDAKHFLKTLKLLAGTTDKAPSLKSALATALRGTERVVEALGGESTTLKSLGGHPATHPLGETYFTQVPLRFGNFIAKVRLQPATGALARLLNQPVDITHAPNALRDLLREFFRTQAGYWDLQVQLCRDLEKMPIEDATVLWSEELSPFQTVARVHVPIQDAWPENSAEAIEDAVSFSPWHALEAHRPLGSIMRARKAAYEASAKFRASHNGVQLSETNPLSDHAAPPRPPQVPPAAPGGY